MVEELSAAKHVPVQLDALPAEHAHIGLRFIHSRAGRLHVASVLCGDVRPAAGPVSLCAIGKGPTKKKESRWRYCSGKKPTIDLCDLSFLGKFAFDSTSPDHDMTRMMSTLLILFATCTTCNFFSSAHHKHCTRPFPSEGIFYRGLFSFHCEAYLFVKWRSGREHTSKKECDANGKEKLKSPAGFVSRSIEQRHRPGGACEDDDCLPPTPLPFATPLSTRNPKENSTF